MWMCCSVSCWKKMHSSLICHLFLDNWRAKWRDWNPFRKATLKLEKLMNWSVQKCWKTRALHELKTRGAPCTTSNEYRSSTFFFVITETTSAGWNDSLQGRFGFPQRDRQYVNCVLGILNQTSVLYPFMSFFFQLENPNSKEKNQKHTDTKTLFFRVFVDWIAGAPSRDDQSDGSTEIGEQERFEAIKERVENKAPYAKCAWYSDYNIPVFSVSHILVIWISHLSLTPFSPFGLACMLLSRKTKNCHTGPVSCHGWPSEGAALGVELQVFRDFTPQFHDETNLKETCLETIFGTGKFATIEFKTDVLNKKTWKSYEFFKRHAPLYKLS